jgi:hypothetical protein
LAFGPETRRDLPMEAGALLAGTQYMDRVYEVLKFAECQGRCQVQFLDM